MIPERERAAQEGLDVRQAVQPLEAALDAGDHLAVASVDHADLSEAKPSQAQAKRRKSQ